MARVLVTGGAGFIGSRYVRRAVGRGDTVTVLDDLSRGGSPARLRALRVDLGATAFRMVQGCVTDQAVVAECCREADAVVHMAGQVAVTESLRDPRRDFDVNALGTLNVLEALRQQAPEAVLVHASTNKVYGSLAGHPALEEPTRYVLPSRPLGIDEAEPLDPQTPYGCSNAAADQYVRDYARLFGLRTVVFRQSCIYGPGQLGSEDQGWVAWLMRAALAGADISIYGNGKQVRDLLYVDDLLDAIDLAIRHAARVAGRAFNVGGGPARSLSVWVEFRDHLATLTGRAPSARLAPWRPADQPVYISDIRRAETELGWQPRTSLADGLGSLRDWLRTSGA